MQITLDIPAPKHSNLATLHAQCLADEINNALNGKFFTVCPLDKVAGIFGVRRPDDALLQSMHCMKWTSMTKEQQSYAVDTTIRLMAQLSGHHIIVD